MFLLTTTNQFVQSVTDNNDTRMKYATGTAVNFYGPGIAILAGFKIKYRMDKHTIPEVPILGIAILSSQTFESVFFVDLHFTFKTIHECEYASYQRKCLESIKLNNFITHPELLEQEFYKCFDESAERIPF